ncbi:MAG: hypothetical protein WBP64_01575 [Nitrososphaeraceae archaeon]
MPETYWRTIKVTPTPAKAPSHEPSLAPEWKLSYNEGGSDQLYQRDFMSQLSYPAACLDTVRRSYSVFRRPGRHIFPCHIDQHV